MSTARCFAVVLVAHSFWIGGVAVADVRLASPFADHMVLQRGKPIPIWGMADANAVVTVTLGTDHGTVNADKSGRWSATLPARAAGGPFVLNATAGGTTATASDVLIGDVFLCSGQSNIQYGLGESSAYAAITARAMPKLRLGKVGLANAAEPQDAFDLRWQAASPAAAKDFSALAYAMAYELYRQDPKLADVPIGMLQVSLGGTVIESWLPKAALAKFDPKTLAMSMFNIGPSGLYNGMIAPLGRMPLAGVVWYQGEGNGAQPSRYAEYLPLLMTAWREQFAQPELPFMIIQLPDYASDWGGVYWQWIRESQANVATADAHAGYVVTLGTNDGWDLHPQGKPEIARRLAMLARKIVYQGSASGRSPAFKAATIDGDVVHVTFDTDGSTLTSGTNAVEGFTLAGEDGVYHAADAVIDGPETVIVRSSSVPRPRTVRYAWAGVPRATLASVAGLPASPFRTDEQPVSQGHGEVQQSPAGYVFTAPRYRISLDGNGRATSLVVGYKQLLSNADGAWGGTNIVGPGGAYALAKSSTDGPDGLRFEGGDVTANLRFGDDVIRWSIQNRGSKDAVRFTVSLSPQAKLAADPTDRGTFIVRRKDAAVTFARFDRVITFDDPAADAGGEGLEVLIPAGETREVTLHVGP